jgi:hypothetical protein
LFLSWLYNAFKILFTWFSSCYCDSVRSFMSSPHVDIFLIHTFMGVFFFLKQPCCGSKLMRSLISAQKFNVQIFILKFLTYLWLPVNFKERVKDENDYSAWLHFGYLAFYSSSSDVSSGTRITAAASQYSHLL